MSGPRTIAIVGAGFSGTVVATNLLKARHWTPTRIFLIERSEAIGRGKAYAQRDYPYLLNVAAGRMSADSRAPLDFLSFARRHIPNAGADDFLPRALYGQYLEARLLDAERAAPAHVGFESLQGDVCTVEKIDHSLCCLQFADGRSLFADDVVLALGNPSPAVLPGTEALGVNEGYIADPWAGPLEFRSDETLLLVGTGLTMVDVALAAAAASKQRIIIHSISRRGLLPASQTSFQHAAGEADAASLLRAASFSSLTLVRKVRELAEQTENRGGDWREAVTLIRNIAPALWQRLPMREKRRLLRHVRPYWDVHRHRVPNKPLEHIKSLRQLGKLRLHAGRPEEFERAGNKVRVRWRPRGARQSQTLVVDRVINCTGPDYNLRHSSDLLMRSLLAQGLAVPDPLHLGLRTGANGSVINSRGRPAANLFYVGPMLRADHWEATAAQELRGHAEQLARHLSTSEVVRMQVAAAT